MLAMIASRHKPMKMCDRFMIYAPPKSSATTCGNKIITATMPLSESYNIAYMRH
jgi:hypothetical protein